MRHSDEGALLWRGEQKQQQQKKKYYNNQRLRFGGDLWTVVNNRDIFISCAPISQLVQHRQGQTTAPVSPVRATVCCALTFLRRSHPALITLCLVPRAAVQM